MPVLKGRIISKTAAEKEINKFLQIREDTFDRIGDALESAGAGSDARTYFSDKEIAFFFEFDLIKRLVEGAGNEANGLLVFYGAAPAAEAGLGIQEGSTTVVLIPSKIETNMATGEIEKVSTVIVNDDSAGGEYPGGFRVADLSKRVLDLRGIQPSTISNLL